MFRKYYFIVILLITIISLSCFPPFTSNKKDKTTPLLVGALLLSSISNANCNNGFWAIDFNTGAYTCRPATLVASGNGIEIYEQVGLNAQTNYASSNFRYSNVVSAYESTINPKITSAIGSPTDIDGNGKITVFVLDIGYGVGGYVDPIQFIEDDPTDSYFRSNQREIIFIDGNALLALRKKDIAANLPDTFLSTLTHEYQHLIRFQYELGFSHLIRTLDDVTNKDFTFDDTWINEGTSEIASDIAGYGPQNSRMACFRGDPVTDCVEGAAGYPLFEWKSSIRNYASAYTFLSYLYHNSGNSETEKNTFIKNTIVGNSSYVRANTVTNMMTIFKSAAKYNSTLLTTDTTGIFRRLYATFLSLAFNPNRYPGTSTFFIGTSNVETMSGLQSAYPLPSTLNPIYMYPSNFGIVKGSTFLMGPSAFYRVSENSSSAPDNADTVKVWNGNPATYGPEFIIFNGRVDTSPVTVSANMQEKSSNRSSFGITKEITHWNPPITKTGELFCPHSFITVSRSAFNTFNIRERFRLYLNKK